MPWADALVGVDPPWWKLYLPEIHKVFKGELFTTAAKIQGVQTMPKYLRTPPNSGAAAIVLAEYFGAERIYGIGFDCHKRNGSHHHGDHPRGLGNAGSMPRWPLHFRRCRERLRAEFINCSPGTALRVFPIGDLDECLAVKPKKSC